MRSVLLTAVQDRAIKIYGYRGRIDAAAGSSVIQISMDCRGIGPGYQIYADRAD